MRLSFRSILARIILLHAVAVAAIMLVLVCSIHVLLDSVLKDYEFATLRAHERSIAAALEVERGQAVLRLPPLLRARYAQHDDGYHFAVLDLQGRVLFGSDGTGRAVTPPGATAIDRPIFVQRPGEDGLYAAASFPARRAGQVFQIQVAQDLGDPDIIADDIVAAFFGKVIWLLAAILAVLVGVDVLIIRRALKPVVDASLMAQAVQPDQIAVRLPTRGQPREILPLVEAVNHALDRLEDGFRAQRDFTADAAHELRTPLSVLRLRIQALCEPATANVLKLDLDVMSRVVSQLLAMADLESMAVAPDQRADLSAICQSVSDHLAPIATATGKAVALMGDESPVWVAGDGELLFQAVRNLVENAITHTREGAFVELVVEARGAVIVRDQGEGVAPADRPLIFQRFWRRNRNHGGGAGLGLSIVARIVELHHGQVDVSEAPGGGAQFEIRLRPA